ncbi:MAG: SOS response-associated peptidase [Bacteroidota bacterium]
MCGRYTLTSEIDAVEVAESAHEHVQLGPRYNIAPSQYCPVIPQHDTDRKIHFYKWGLLPHWARDPKMAYRMINARGETIHQKPSYKESFQKRRCLVLADGFYEWQKLEKGKQPMWISLNAHERFYMAGIYSYWKSPEGKWLETFSVITTSPNPLMAPIHDRMPVILPENLVDDWLDPSMEIELLLKLLVPYDETLMTTHPVSSRVGNVRNDDAELIQPLST